MALSFLDNVDYRGKKPNFTRDLFETIVEMVAFSENYLPDIFITCNKEDGKIYIFNRNNTVDVNFGKWRELQGGSGGASDWDSLIGRPFKDIDGNVFTVDENGVLTVEIPEVPIEKVKVNGTELEINSDDKSVDIIVPTLTSELTNDSDFVSDVDYVHTDNNFTTEEKDKLESLENYDDSELAYRVISNEEAIAILNGDSDGSVTKTVNDAINEFATNLSDDGFVNTFKELVDYVAEHGSDVTEMISDIENNATSIENVSDRVTTIEDDYLTSVDKIELTEAMANKLDSIQSVDEAGKILVVADDGSITFADPSVSGGDTAENIAYTNADYSQYSNVDLALDALFAKVYYVKPTCSLYASPTGGTFEMGTTITAPITFTWTTNKDITTQTLTNCTLADETVRTATYDTDITSDKTFTLSVSDGENSATSSVSYKFMNNVFWGSAPIGTYDSAFINALSNKKLTTSVKGTYSFNVANGEYGFWAVPSNMTISTVWIGGFEVTVESVGTISYENSQGYTRDYNLYKTGQSGLGSISAEIK